MPRARSAMQEKKIGGVNDNCSTFNEIDVHVVDTFASVVRQFFENSGKSGFSGLLEGKTYDLKSAHRQVPIIQEHTKFAYFSVYNRESGRRRFTVWRPCDLVALLRLQLFEAVSYVTLDCSERREADNNKFPRWFYSG